MKKVLVLMALVGLLNQPVIQAMQGEARGAERKSSWAESVLIELPPNSPSRVRRPVLPHPRCAGDLVAEVLEEGGFCAVDPIEDLEETFCSKLRQCCLQCCHRKSRHLGILVVDDSMKKEQKIKTVYFSDSCSICSKTYSGLTRDVGMLLCGHMFCRRCLPKLLNYSVVCPVCTEKINKLLQVFVRYEDLLDAKERFDEAVVSCGRRARVNKVRGYIRSLPKREVDSVATTCCRNCSSDSCNQDCCGWAEADEIGHSSGFATCECLGCCCVILLGILLFLYIFVGVPIFIALLS